MLPSLKTAPLIFPGQVPSTAIHPFAPHPIHAPHASPATCVPQILELSDHLAALHPCPKAQRENGVAVPYKNNKDARCVRRIGPLVDLMCGRCLNWVSTNATSLQASYAAMKPHQRSKPCCDRVKHLQKWCDSKIPHQHLSSPPAHATPPSFLSTPAASQSVTSPGCPGVALNWPAEYSIMLQYPFMRHHPGSRSQLPWDLHQWDPDSRTMFIRARGCSGAGGADGTACVACKGVSHIASNKICSMLHEVPTTTSNNYGYMNWLSLRDTAMARTADYACVRRKVCSIY